MDANEPGLEVSMDASMVWRDSKLMQHVRAPKHPAVLVKQRASAGRALGVVTAVLGLTGWVLVGHEFFFAGMTIITLMWCRVLWVYVRARKRVVEYEEVWEAHPEWALEKLVSYHTTALATRGEASVELKASRRRLSYAFGAFMCALAGLVVLPSVVPMGESTVSLVILGIVVAGAGVVVVAAMMFEHQALRRKHSMIEHEHRELRKLSAGGFNDAMVVGGLSATGDDVELGQLSVSDTHKETSSE